MKACREKPDKLYPIHKRNIKHDKIFKQDKIFSYISKIILPSSEKIFRAQLIVMQILQLLVSMRVQSIQGHKSTRRL